MRIPMGIKGQSNGKFRCKKPTCHIMVDEKISDEGSVLLAPGKSVHVADEGQAVLVVETVHGVSRPIDAVGVERLPALVLKHKQNSLSKYAKVAKKFTPTQALCALNYNY